MTTLASDILAYHKLVCFRCGFGWTYDPLQSNADIYAERTAISHLKDGCRGPVVVAWIPPQNRSIPELSQKVMFTVYPDMEVGHGYTK